MNDILTDRLRGSHPQMLRAELRSQANADPKKLADLRLVVGRLVERAFQLMGITKQEAAYGMGYHDPGAVSRWCSATERPLFDKLFLLKGFKVAYVVALAETETGLDVETIVTIRRTA